MDYISKMTDDRRASKQSKLLAPLGLITSGELSGQPIFQFKRASVYMVDRRKSSSMGWHEAKGIFVPNEQEWERVPQFGANDNRWSIGQWRPPSYTQEQWVEKFGFLLDYPRNGWWWFYLPLEYLPDEEWTLGFLDLTMKNREYEDHNTYAGKVQDTRDFYERGVIANNKKIADMVDDCFVDHVPGKRGGTYSAPRTRFDR